MGQIVKRKKKGRPSKADLARRAAADAENNRRRSLRRRNVRYNNYVDNDDYLDEFEEDEEERRRQKKVKLVVKLNNQEDRRNRTARGYHAREDAEASLSEEEEEDDDGSERKLLKKRKINGRHDSEAEEESENDQENEDEIEEETERKANTKGLDSTPGTPPHHPNGMPLPLSDKKSLELILDKLQKKDTYGVYAEPVDLEELPDYLDVIDHPMDFATVRKKLGNGSYSTLEQFESDVYLICSNAMQYNSPDTIYHKQACTIQELAKKKFHKLRIDLLRSEKEPKSEQKTKPNFSEKKQMKKPLNKTVQEPIGSDFFSGANLATANNIQNFLFTTQGSGYDRPNIMEKTVGGISSLVDNNLDKVEELSSGTGILPKFGRKPPVPDEDRRATYNLFNESVTRSESVFATFQNEIKQLVAVGLHAECSYARSMARFAATLGPVAWKVASKRIEQALPPGCKFGRGWVGEYEPLPTPVLLVEQRESTLFAKSHGTLDVVRGDISKVPSKENQVRAPTSQPVKDNHVKPPNSDNEPTLFRPTSFVLEGRPSTFSPSGSKPSPAIPVDPPKQKPNIVPSNFGGQQHKASKQVELNLPPSNFQHDSDAAEKKLLKNSEMASSTQKEMPRTVGLLESVSSKQPDNSVVSSGGLQNGKVSNSTNSRMSGTSSNGLPHQMAQVTTLFSKGREQVLNDPVEAMRASAEMAQKQQKPSNQSSVPSARDDSSDAAATAARAWMSIGSAGFKQPTENSPAPKNHISAESLYNPTRQQHPQFPQIQGHQFNQGQFSRPPGMQFQFEKNGFPFQAFMRPPDGHFQNRPMIFPQFAAADLARLQMQSQWRGLAPHSQPKQKQEMLPPDLNIGFQSPDSPVKQSASVAVDSKQPDLALQL